MMKLRERVVGAALLAVTGLITCLLWVGISCPTQEASSRRPYLNIQRTVLQQGSRNSESEVDREPQSPEVQNTTAMYDELVEWLIRKLQAVPEADFRRERLRRTSMADLVSSLGGAGRRASKRLPAWNAKNTGGRPNSNYYRFHQNARAAALYEPDDPAIDGLIRDMATKPFQTLEMMTRGTELKLLVKFDDRSQAVFKPMRWGRDHETLPNHYYFNDYERHNAEIAAFHLDRVLGFYRVPPVTGRIVNMTSEIFLLAEKALRKTFYVSPIGNMCFFGECTYYCDSRHSFCGEVDMLEGSLMAWLPEPPAGERDRWRSPYRRSYSKFRKADWEEDDGYCRQKLMQPDGTYLYPRFIPDLVDTHIFDFMTGNMDRHHVEVFQHLRNDSAPLLMDNGRGFGKSAVDEMSILAPLQQCCKIRLSTLHKLAKLYIGPERLSELLDKSLRSDPVYPVLATKYMPALDRRLLIILRAVATCVKEYSVNDVIVPDKF
ncbi:extracellular serine/threonine protein CG31145-like [Mya arenaria]|uniref:extracellular serine/threonine protein CG31145-like n=1 Tax=Mya arenaria TaxID=6604 RepID=UPI0022E89EAB|nr:extracellular serine/threonine protein CG31145-like [Mya arenaria]XP_052765557.1 extracellular serine/threonine protein CG31145-like [Mya arenaria]XP_052765558.1 extracellular serine/threonine protein CG31145-like [Mya arenaria]